MELKNNAGYLLHHLSFVLDRQSDQLLQERLGIGFSQFKILMALKCHTNVQQKQIAEYLGQTEASISRQIKLMTDLNLLQSIVNPASRREHRTTLTIHGDRVTAEAMQLLNDFHAPLFATLDSEQQQQLLDALTVMHKEACRSTKRGTCNH